MKFNFLSLLHFQSQHTYTRQSGQVVDGYIQAIWTSGLVSGFAVPNVATDEFRPTDQNFMSRADQLFITKSTLTINDIIGDYQVTGEVEVTNLIGLNIYELKKLV